MARKPSRSADESVLAWVKARSAGRTPAQIAQGHRACPEAVARATDAVRDEDAATGEDIAGFYW